MRGASGGIGGPSRRSFLTVCEWPGVACPLSYKVQIRVDAKVGVGDVIYLTLILTLTLTLTLTLIGDVICLTLTLTLTLIGDARWLCSQQKSCSCQREVWNKRPSRVD